MSLFNENDLNKIITVETLEHYDKNIKKWVTGKLSDSGNDESIIFGDVDSFPSVGKTNVLYVSKHAIYQWDDGNNIYIKMDISGDISDAKEYADNLNTEMDKRVKTLEEKSNEELEPVLEDEIASLFS